jgi:hypothetical protein
MIELFVAVFCNGLHVIGDVEFMTAFCAKATKSSMA